MQQNLGIVTAGPVAHGGTSMSGGALLAPAEDTAPPLTLPKLCPECQDSGHCQNRFACKLVCWLCGGQTGFGFKVPA